MQKIGWFVVVMDSTRSTAMLSFNGAHNIRPLSSYLALIEPVLRFRDIASYLSTVADFHLLHLHLTIDGVTPVEFGVDLWRQKNRVLVALYDPKFSHF